MTQPGFPRAAFESGYRFVASRARPLDHARLASVLGICGPDAVLESLAPYQNMDGGFGQALEPDLRTPISTALATSVGLRVLRELDVPAQHPMVRRAINWLIAKVDRERLVWPIIPAAAAQTTHAPWWDFHEDMEERWNHYRYNPSAELFGALCHWRTLVPDDLFTNMTGDFFWRLQNKPPEAIYDLYCCLRLQENQNLPDSIRAPLETAIQKCATAQDPESIHVNYFELVPARSSLLYGALKDRFEIAAQRALETQAEDGGWHPAWNWSDVDPSAWAVAEVEWSGVLTRTILETVHRHGLVV